MDNNKKKALIKSVAAFTFAMSMFTAQSTTASALEGQEIADTNAAGYNVLSDDEDEEETAEIEEAGDDKGDIVTSQDVIPETGAELVNSNGMAIGETYYDSDFYDKDAELGIANNFHIFTNGTVENNAHVNGNIAAGNIGTDKNFGTNDLLEGDITYAESFASGVNRGGSTNPTIILGSENTIEEANNGNGCIVTSPDGGSFTENNKDNIFIEQEGTKYIDLDAEMKVYENLSDVLAEYTETETDTDFSDMNNSYIVINEDGLSVVNITATEFSNIAVLNIKNLVGCGDDSNQTLLINVDGEGTDVVINSQVKVYYEDGTERNNKEVTDFTDSRILWNFINTNNIAINNIFSGCVLAPDADVTFGANFDGNVIAQNVTIGGESHRWDFHGDLQLEEIEDSDIPTGSDPFENPDEPTVDDPTVDEPTVDEPTVDDPTVDEPTVDDPTVDDPTVDEPTVDDPTVDEPTVDDPTVDEPTVDDPTVDEPTVDDPTVDEPTVDDPTVDEPTVDDPTVDEPTVDDPTVDEPTVDDPTVDEPTVDEPTVDDPTVDEPTGDDILDLVDPIDPVVPNTPNIDVPVTPSTPDTTIPTTPSVVPSTPNTSAPTAPSAPSTTAPSAPVVNNTTTDTNADTVAPAPVAENSNNTSDAADTSNTDNLVDFDDSDVPLGNDPLESFEDGNVPLGDDPLLVDGATENPTTGNSMALPRGAAAAAIASFLTMLYANKKNREEAAE